MRVLFCAAALGVALVGPVWAEGQPLPYLRWAKEALANAKPHIRAAQDNIDIACALATEYDNQMRTDALATMVEARADASHALSYAKSFLEQADKYGMFWTEAMQEYAWLRADLDRVYETFETCGVKLPPPPTD